jgi:hypothetical protein
VIRGEHRGLAHARNRGISEAHGEYICALDADDRLEPRFFEKTVAVLNADPDVTFASAWLRTFGDEHWEWKPERCDVAALLREDTVLTAALVRRSAVLDADGYDTGMPVQGDEDWDLWLTLVERGARGVIIPDILFNYRRRAGSMSSICWHGAGHMPLADYRFAKHRAAYERHLVDVLLGQDAETAALLADNDALERRITSDLEPAVAARRSELERLRQRLAMSGNNGGPDAALNDRLASLQAANRNLAAEVEALRASASWRVTAPLRRAYGWWLKTRAPREPSSR